MAITPPRSSSSLSEFQIIARYFTPRISARDDVLLGIGDDAALLRVPPGAILAVSIDTLVAGVHFPLSTPPQAIGHKALAVNLSDLAAMGATPAWVTLALTLPAVDEPWLERFAAGFFNLAQQHRVALVGGDTTRGPLTITVQAHGWIPLEQHALTRGGAQPGDVIYVTGTLGDAALGLTLARTDPRVAAQQLIARLDYPTPRLAAGLALHGVASSAIDISDGLLADLGHILAASGVGATVHVDALPRSRAFQEIATVEQSTALALGGGDDYELCFTCPAALAPELPARFASMVPITPIGIIESTPGCRLLHHGQTWPTPPTRGYDHFPAR